MAPRTEFNVDAVNGELTSFPVSNITTPYQVCTQVGTSVLTASTSAGLIIVLPNWAEKILGWHYPMDPSTQTFGVPEAIPFSLDIDQFYERFRLLSAVYTVQAGTVSTTNAALSGTMNAVEAYNSLASLQGNGSTVFQIYSYGNTLGLTPDPSRRVGAVPSWKGVSAIFLNTPRKTWSRLEDSTNYTPTTYVNAANSAFKFVDSNDSYSLCGRLAWDLPASTVFDTTTALQTYTYASGPILVDSVRAATISWVVDGSFAVQNVTGTLTQARHFVFRLKYKMRDIAGTVQNEGILDIHYVEAAPNYGTLAFGKSGAFPTNLNIDETLLVPPIRTIEFIIEVSSVIVGEGQYNINWVQQPRLNIEVPVNNGLIGGLIQNPLLINYAGIEVGTKITMNGNLRMETIADSATAKFVTPIFRKVKLLEETAIMKILSDPLHYGIRFITSSDQLQHNMDLINTAIQAQVQKGVDKVLASFMHAKNVADAGGPEASVRSMLKKGFKGIKKISKDEFNDLVKPAAQDLLKDIKGVGKSAAHKAIQTAMESLLPVAATANVYSAPRVSYPALNQSKINAQAAAGWVGPAFSAMTKPIRHYEDYEKRNLTEEKNRATGISQSPSEPDIVPLKETLIKVPRTSVTLFPALYTDKEGELIEEYLDRKKTVGSIFGFVPVRLVDLPTTVPKTRIIGHSIYWYTATKGCPIATNIDPGEDVVCMRLSDEDDENFYFAFPTKPVTGRSCDLALWAYQKGLKNGLVYSGEIENGKVLPLPVSTSAVKLLLTTERNNFILVANIPTAQSHSLVHVTDLISIGPTLLKLHKKTIPLNAEYWHADVADMLQLTHGHYDSVLNQWFNLPEHSPLSDVFYDPDRRLIVATSIPEFVPVPNFRHPMKSGEFVNDDSTYINWVIKPTISEFHALNIALAKCLPVFPGNTLEALPRDSVACAATAAVTLNRPEVLGIVLKSFLNDQNLNDIRSDDYSKNVSAAKKLLRQLELVSFQPKTEKFGDTSATTLPGQVKLIMPKVRKVPKKLEGDKRAKSESRFKKANGMKSLMDQVLASINNGNADNKQKIDDKRLVRLFFQSMRTGQELPDDILKLVRAINFGDVDLLQAYMNRCAELNMESRISAEKYASLQ